MNPAIRHGEPEDLVDVMRLFDGALLETNVNRIQECLTGDGGCVLIATTAGRPIGAIAVFDADETNEKVVWADSVYISAIAVQNERRGCGIGRSLITAAAEWAAPQQLSATFDKRVRPFYRACSFEIEEREGRLWGRRSLGE